MPLTGDKVIKSGMELHTYWLSLQATADLHWIYGPEVLMLPKVKYIVICPSQNSHKQQ